MTKQELADALEAVPLGAQRNRLNVALLLTGEARWEFARRARLDETLVSRIANGRRDPTPVQRELIAKYFGVTAAVMFPPQVEPAYAEPQQ